MDEEQLQSRVRAAVAGAGAVTEIRMFGGIGFMLNGNLLAGASRRGLLLRVGAEREPEALRRAGARRMVMRGRTLAGYVYVDSPALDAAGVDAWLALALSYVSTLPPKRKRRARAPSRAAPAPRRTRTGAHPAPATATRVRGRKRR
jgi:TfoX/Sxy family transcriptional regulator of competence genes